MRALVIVDYQVDFVHGSLAVPGAEEIRNPILDLALGGPYGIIAATQDWHPDNHCSFSAQGGPWPVHCVQGTVGASISGGLLQVVTSGWTFRKGDDPLVEEYSGANARDWHGDRLSACLLARGICWVEVVGLALDYCVKATALDLAEHFETTVRLNATRPVAGDTGLAAVQELLNAGVKIV